MLLNLAQTIQTDWGLFGQEHIHMMLWLLLLPLGAFAIQIFIGNKLPRQGDWLPTCAMGVSLLLSLLLLAKSIEYGLPSLLLHSGRPQGGHAGFSWNWLYSLVGNGDGKGNFVFALLYDNLTAVMLVVVTGVSFLVHVFSLGYMKGDVRYSRYFAYLAIFTFAMIGLVLSANFISLFVCWELMGLASYLLIGHYFQKDSAANAAKKAFLTTRVGDAGMFVGMMMLWAKFETFDFLQIFEESARIVSENGGVAPAWMTICAILLFMGPVGKSAQFPLHIWLPDAMEGPTPVSALIHAATMVAAGVFLIARLFPFFLFVPDALLVVALLGGVTAIFAATIGLTQFDIKKVLAYSTVSQLGFMVCALGCGALAAGSMHLMTHAWFKGCLFLCSGSVILGMHHHQDMREMGGLRKKMPITYITMLLSTMAIAGVPLFSGFYSKDAIIAATLHPAPGYASILGENGAQGFLWSLPKFIIPIAAFMTAFYMFRLIIMTFHGKPKSEHAEHAKESPISVTLPLMILAVLSVFAASPWIFNFDVFGHHIWFNELVAPMTFDSAGTLSLPSRVEIVDHGWLPVIISLVVAGSGIFLAFAVYQWKIINAASIAKAFGPVYTLVYRKYFIDEFVMRFIVKPLVFTWNVWCAAFDKFVIDGIVNGVGRTTKRLASGAGWWDKNVVDGSVNLLAFVTQIFAAISRIFQTGFLQHYLTTLAIFAVVGLAMFGGWMQWVLLGAIPVSFVGFVYLTRRA